MKSECHGSISGKRILKNSLYEEPLVIERLALAGDCFFKSNEILRIQALEQIC